MSKYIFLSIILHFSTQKLETLTFYTFTQDNSSVVKVDKYKFFQQQEMKYTKQLPPNNLHACYIDVAKKLELVINLQLDLLFSSQDIYFFDQFIQNDKKFQSTNEEASVKKFQDKNSTQQILEFSLNQGESQELSDFNIRTELNCSIEQNKSVISILIFKKSLKQDQNLILNTMIQSNNNWEIITYETVLRKVQFYAEIQNGQFIINDFILDFEDRQTQKNTKIHSGDYESQTYKKPKFIIFYVKDEQQKILRKNKFNMAFLNDQNVNQSFRDQKNSIFLRKEIYEQNLFEFYYPSNVTFKNFSEQIQADFETKFVQQGSTVVIDIIVKQSQKNDDLL